MDAHEPKSGITQRELIGWGGPEIFNQALAIAAGNNVVDVRYDDDKLEISGRIIQPDGWAMPCKLQLQAGRRIRSLCPCATNQRFGQICPHVVALGLARMVMEMDDAPAEKPAAESAPLPAAPEIKTIKVPMAPWKFAARVMGSRASLAIEVDVYYGRPEWGFVDLPLDSMQDEKVVWFADPDDPAVRYVRTPEAERAAVKRLREFGFQPGYKPVPGKYFLTDQHQLLNFLGAGLPALRRDGHWEIALEGSLGSLVDSFDCVVPTVEIRDAGRGDFDIRYEFEAFHEGGKTAFAPAEIQAALNRGDGYILKDGRVALLDTAAVESMHDVFRDCAAAQGGAPAGWFRVRGIHAPYVKASFDDLGIEYDDRGAAEWRALTAKRSGNAEAKFEPVALGALESVLRPYQKQGVYWMRFLERSGFSGLLADEMGLGKTLQTLAWLKLPRTDGRGAGLPAIIVCPTSLVRNWQAEAKRFLPELKTLVISGPDRARAFPLMDRADVVITSYALLQRDFEQAYCNRRFSVAVLDEAQHIKNRKTRNATAAKGLMAFQRLVLTGTPIENSVADVWSIFNFLMPEYLGEYEEFKTGYEQPIAEGGVAATNAQAKLKRRLDPFILRRLKSAVAKDLPRKIVKVSYCPMPEESQREYNEVLQKERRGAKTKFQMLALLMKLRRIASRGKVEAFMEQLDEALDGGHRVLVFSQFVSQLKVLCELLTEEGIPFCYLDGSTQDRLGECEKFNHNSSIPVFLISLMAGGTGLNLTGADMVMHYDPWWNPAVEDQATDRAHRIGQTRQVYVIKLIAADTVEEKVLALQQRKQAVIAATVSTSDEAIVEKLTAEDLASLLE